MKNNIVQFSNVSKLYPGVNALDCINFNISKGSIHGFMGPNGAGKSTTMKILAGLLKESSGEILFNSEKIEFLKDKSRIAYLPEVPAFYKGMTVDGFLSFCYQIFFKTKIKKEKLKYVLDICGLESVNRRIINHLSKGFKQKVAIAQSLIIEPELIIMDEPTVGLDPLAQIELRELIINLKKEHTIFLSSHLLHDLSLICDEITFIDKGNIILSDTLENVLEKQSDKVFVTFKSLNWSNEFKSKIQSFSKCEIKETSSNNYMKIKCIFDFKIEENKFLKFLIDQNLEIVEFKKESADLEDLFLKGNK